MLELLVSLPNHTALTIAVCCGLPAFVLLVVAHGWLCMVRELERYEAESEADNV